MNINSLDGSITFEGGSINRLQNRTQFLNSQFGKVAREALVNGERRQYDFEPEPGVAVTVFFQANRLDRVFLMMAMPSDSSKIQSEAFELERKTSHDAWLRVELGTPPYEYPWGAVTSNYEPRDCSSEIIVTYAT